MSRSLFDEIDTDNFRSEAVNPASAPDLVTSFLGRLNLLHGVPFEYFVPDEKLLPPESLKFFSIDPQWLNGLIGGALSVGRGNTIRFLLNKTLAGTFAADILEEARAVRHRSHTGEAPATRVADDTATDAFSGFLLRSRILEGWPGLEVRAYSSSGQQTDHELAMLRLDRVAADVLFGLVDGQLDKLEITQPPEGLHFAVKDKPIFRNEAMRVLDIRGMAGPSKTGAASFAERNISQPLRFTFVIGR
jgi:hypothetical protein